MKFLKSIILSSIGIIVFISCTSNSAQVKVAVVKQDTIIRKLKDTISITAVGDIMLGSAFPSKTNLPPDDAVNSFEAVDSLLKGDIVFGNLEGCFLNSGNSNKCNGINPNNCYAFRMTEQGKENKKIDGFTPDQRFFLSFAQVWRIKNRDERMRMRLKADPHSPEMFRVNGPVYNMEAFYKAFNVPATAKMYIAPENRLGVW